jgi:undecaprenyl-diphosphatase
MLKPFWKLLDWLGSHEMAVRIAMLLVVVGIWAFVELADEVVEGQTQKFDDRIILALRRADDPGKPIGPVWLPEVGRDCTAVGGIAMLTLVTGSVVGFHLITRRYRAAGFITAATLGGLVMSSILKASFDRPRPQLVPHLSDVMSSSFPSGHSMMAAVVYLTLGALLAGLTRSLPLRVYYIFTSVMITVLVGVSRVYMGVHYPTDVLAGWTAGLVWAMLCWLLAQVLRRRGALESDDPRGD